MEELYSGIDLGEPVPEGIDQKQVYAYVESGENVAEAMDWSVMPRGNIVGGRYEPPTANRKDYLVNRTREAFESDFAFFEELDEKKFPHAPRRGSLNYYAKDMGMVMAMLHARMNRPLLVVNGFRSTREGLTNAHTAGLAVDIGVSSYKEALEIADEAWLLGIRAIGIAGDFEEGDGFVHLDIGPEATLNYGGKTYRGPGL